MDNAIIFAGCSFTYGEGLELYTDTPKWIKQRNYSTHDAELKKLVDDDGTNFRLSNNFPGLISNHCNIKALQHHMNGGCFASSTRFIKEVQKVYQNKSFNHGYVDEDIINFFSEKNKNIKCIIIQLSALDREPLHFDYDCRCEMCGGTLWAYFGTFYSKLSYLHDKIILKKKVRKAKAFEKKWFSFIMSKMYDNFNYDEFIEKSLNDKVYFSDIMENVTNNIDSVISKLKKESLILNQKLIEKFEKEIAPVYFIDSWCTESSKLFTENEFYYNKMIPLKGADGRHYKKWSTWKKTFTNFTINDDFPKTENDHPNKDTHKFLAESLIKFLNKKRFF